MTRFASVALIFFATLAWADSGPVSAPSLPPPVGTSATTTAPSTGLSLNHAGNDGLANEDLAKELESFQKVDALLPSDSSIPALPGLNNLPAGTLEWVQDHALRLLRDDSFLQASRELLTNWTPALRARLLGFQLAWFLGMKLLKAWLQGRRMHWFRRFLLGIICSLVTWFGLSYAIPVAVLGDPYRRVLATLWHVIVQGK